MTLDTAPVRDIEVESPDAPTAPPALIAHILRRYHEVHMAEFPEAIGLARRVEAVHGAHPRCPTGIADHLALMADDLEGHQRKEEGVLFPMMLNGGSPMIAHPIARMTDEHRDVVEQLRQLAVMTNDFTPPEGACTSWRALYAMCSKLDADLREHMRLENDVLFPQFI